MEAHRALTLLVLLLPTSILAGPVNHWKNSGYDEKCVSTCTESSNFGYDVGKTYRYSYETTGVNSIPGASDQSSTVFASAIANIHVISKCEMALHISDVSFKISDPDTFELRDITELQFAEALTENILEFSFQDGRVDRLCPSVEDDPDVLNFKRGVLSLFQTSLPQLQTDQSLREIDVSGNCPTDFTVQKGWKATEITKTKDLLGCTERQHYHTSLQSTPFHIPDAIQSLPLLKGDLKCSHTVSKDGWLTKASCSESLIFRPFSKKESGAKAEITQKLTHLDARPRHNLQRADTFKPTTLIFDHLHMPLTEGEEMWGVRDVLEKMCKSSSHGVTKQVPGLFTEMVYLMKDLPYNTMNDLWSGINNGFFSSDSKERARQFFLDALPTVGTEASVKLMVDLLHSDIVTGVRAKIWLMSFTFLQYPNRDMMKTFSKLLRSEKLRMEALLPVTSAVHIYCKEEENCQSQSEVKDIVSLLEDILGRDCQSKDKELVLTTLRATGNLGFSDAAVPTLENCIEMSGNAMEVRVAAIQAFRGVTCQGQRKSLMDVFINKGEDAELRINAYLGLMKCPTEKILAQVQSTLENEEVNQVGSFVWTHLTNLAETASPLKQEVKAIVQNENLRKEFDMDKRKYSRNYEWSFFAERFGLGGVAESNLIWSQTSFVPRSAMVNLTVDVLGHSVNLFEVGGRLQGVQQWMTNLMKQKKPEKGDNSAPCYKKGKMDNMNEKHSVEEEELSASLYLRMFGNELTFKHFKQDELLAKNFDAKDMIPSLAKGKEISFTHSAMFLDSTVIVPTIAGMTLQLSVNGTATVQVKAKGKMDLRRLSLKKMEMNFDFAPSGAVQFGGEMTLNAWRFKNGLKMTTTLHSSTAFKGSLDLTNGQVLKVTADTPGDKMELLDAQSEFLLIHNKEVRQQKMLEEKASIQQRGCSDDHWVRSVGYQLCGQVAFVNTTLIRDSPYFPLTGPMSISVVLHKRDVPQGFSFLAENIHSAASSLGRISINTPGSKADRALGLSYFLDSKAHSFEAEAFSPWKKVAAKGTINMDKKARKLSGLISVDDNTLELTMSLDKRVQGRTTIWSPNLQIQRPKELPVLAKVPTTFGVSGSITLTKFLDEIALDLDVVTDLKPSPVKLQANYINKKVQKTLSAGIILNKKQGYSVTLQSLQTYFGKNTHPSKIKPTILISTPQWRPFLLSGNIDYKHGKTIKSNLQVTMDQTMKSPVTLTFRVVKSKTKFKGNGKFSSQFGTIKSKGFVDVAIDGKGKKGSMLASKISTNYNFPVFKTWKLRKNFVVFSSKIHDRSSKSLTKYDANVIVDSRDYKEISFAATADLTHKETFTKSILTLKTGPKAKNLKDKKNQMRFEASLNHKLSKKDVDVKYEMLILNPVKAIEWQINGKHEHHLREKISLETYNSFVFAKGKNSELRLKIDSNDAKSTDYNGLFEFNYPTFKIGDKKYDGRTYQITSSIKESPKNEYTQKMQVNINRKDAHSMITKLSLSQDSNYNLKSKIILDGKKKTKVILESIRQDNKMKNSFKYEKDGKGVSGDTTTTLNEEYVSSSFRLADTTKTMEGSLEAGKKKGEYLFKLQVVPDAKKKPNKKVGTDMRFSHAQQSGSDKIEYSLSVNTPIEGYETFEYSELFLRNKLEQKNEFKLVLFKKDNEFSYKIWVMLPPTLSRCRVNFEIITPSERLRFFRTEIRHALVLGQLLDTSVKTKINKVDSEVKISANHKSYELQKRREGEFEVQFKGAERDTLRFEMEDLSDDLTFNPIYQDWAKSIKIRAMHKQDEISYDNELAYVQDKAETKVSHHTTLTRVGKMTNLRSKIDVLLDQFNIRPVSIEIIHANTLTNLNTTVFSTWGLNQKAKIDAGATFMEHDQSLYVHYSGMTEHIHDMIYKQHHNTLNGWSGSSFTQINKDPTNQWSSKYKYTKTEMKIENFSPRSRYVINAEYERFPYTVFGKYSFKNGSAWLDIVLEGSVLQNKEQDWTSDLKLVMPFQGIRNIDIKGNLKKNQQKRWLLTGEAALDVRKKINFKFLADTDKWTRLEADVKTPWRNMGLNIMNRKMKRSLKVDAKVKLETGMEIVGKLYTRFKLPEKLVYSFDLSTPFDVMKKFNLKGNVNKEGKKWNGNVDLKTSSDSLKFFKIDFDHAMDATSLDNDIDITSSSFDRVATGVHLSWDEKDHHTNFTLVAPYINRTMVGYTLRAKSWVDFNERIFGEIQGHELDIDYGLKHKPEKTNAWMTFSYPGADKSFIKTKMHRNGKSIMDFDIGGDVQIGKNNQPQKASMQFSFVDGKTALGATLETSITESFSFLLNNEKKATEQESTIYAKYGEGYMLDLYDKFQWSDSSITSQRRLGYLYKGKGHSSNYMLETNWSEDGTEFSLASQMDDQKVTVSGSLTPATANTDKSEMFDMFVTTPFDNFNDLELHAKVKEEKEEVHGEVSLEYMDGKEAVLTMDVKTQDKKIVANGELILPIEGYEKNTITYFHTVRPDLLNVNAEVITGQGETLKATLVFREKEEFVFDLVGPFREFQTLKLSGKYNEYSKRLNGDLHLMLSMHQKAVTIEFDIDVSDDPAVITFRLRSPYENFRRADLVIKQRGRQLSHISTTSTLTSEKIGTVTLETTVRYASPESFEGMAVLTSSVKHMENINLLLKTEADKNKVMSSRLEFGWDVDKEITVRNTWLSEDSKMESTIDITTPFEEVKALKYEFSDSRNRKLHNSKIFFQLNDKTHVDADISYKMKNHEMTIDIRQPKPMSVKLQGEVKDRTFDGKMLLNLDKNLPQREFEIVTHASDKSDSSVLDTEFTLKLIHPVRIMAVEYLIRSANNEMQTSGLVTWDESRGNTFSYDIGYVDRSSMYSQMYDAHVKMGVPQRSVKVLGSYGDTGSTRTMTGTALWDADRDETKKVTLSTSHEYAKQMERLSLNLNLPSINKQMNMGVSLKRGYGSSILDSKTEISYSSDSRKNIHITTKISNAVLDTDDDYNYSLETGFQHPITDIDLQTTSHVSNIGGVKSAGSKLTYLTVNKEQKVFSWRVENNNKSGKLTITTPVKSVSVVGKHYAVDGTPFCTVELFEEDRKSLAFSGSLLPRAQRFEATVHYDRDDFTKKMFINGGYVSESSASLMVSDSEEVYANMKVNLNDSNILHSRIQWKPTMPEELGTFLRTKLTAFSYMTNEIWDGAVQTVGSEVKAKYNLASQELREEMGQLFSLIKKEMEILSVQLDTLKVKVRRMYSRNDLHLRDMGKQVEEALAEAVELLQSSVSNYQEYYNNVSRSTAMWIETLKNYPISFKYNKAIGEMIQTLKEVRLVLEKTLSNVVMGAEKVMTESAKGYWRLTKEMDSKLNSYLKSKQKLAIFKQMMEEKARLAQMGAQYNPKGLAAFDSHFLMTQEVLENQFHDLMDRPEFKQLHAMGTEIYQQMKQWNPERGIAQGLSRLLDLTKNLLLMEMARIKNILIDMKKTRITYYNPQQGELQFEVHIPFEVKSLTSPPEFKIGEYAKDAYKWVEGRIPDTNISMWDRYYENVPSLNPSQWVPPFEATAYVLGSQHIITFDKTHLNFLSSCSHVLARDMLRDSFSIILNYNRNPVRKGIKSLCFNVGKSFTLEITKDYKLTVNKQETEMPFVNDFVKVVRDGDTIRVQYVNGVEIVSNPTIDLYKVTLSGMFHGMTAGLLGKYDNERSNENAMESRLHEYEVHRRHCSNNNMAVKPDSSEDVAGICSELFLSESSKYRPCFKQVNPEAFVEMCQVYMSYMKDFDAVHRVIEQYRSVCRDSGVFLGPLDEYSPCRNDKAFMVEGSDPLYQSADVVFVMEDTKCNQWASNSLSSMVTEMNKALMSAGMTKNRFGIAGYQAQDVAVRTLHGEHFGSANIFLKAVETMSFEEREIDGDLVTAVRTAMRYPFRPGVAKVLVLAPCTPCQVGILERNLDSSLRSAGFKVHILQDNGFSLLDAAILPQLHIYGLDNSQTITNGMSSVIPRSRVAMSVDNYCNRMAGTTNGSVFDTTFLSHSKTRVQREFIKSFANKVGWGTKLPACQTCQCNRESEKVECQLCGARSYLSYLPLQPATMSGMLENLHDMQYDTQVSLSQLL